MPIEQIHPMAAHFPIALLITSIFLDFLGFITKKDTFEKSAFHILVLGILGAVGAIIFGLIAEDVASKRPNIGETIETHETLAFITTGIFIALLIIRYIFMKKDNFQKIRPYYFIGALIGIILLFATARFGGQMVFEYGAAVSENILK
ncbi:MAG: DUF2231 domain-containing protein [Deltaproteobacteria bacterium]|nr:DUF2231 domain-containing protein [Deltaproteobacteria bacterium]MBI3755774.1 DUF2231 domain-containing protein [Deltaproteobacteria bacterium]